MSDKFYNEELYESIEHPNFFDASELKFVVDGYNELYNSVCSKIELQQEDNYIRIEEANFTRGADGRLDWCQIVSSVRDKLHDKVQRVQMDYNKGEPGFEFVDNLNDWTSKIILIIHCDGQDVKTRLKNTVPRPEHHPNYAFNEFNPGEFSKHAHQGLVNLDAQSERGTIIFDQWFPYSTYYDIASDIENIDEKKRPVITFAKGDEFKLFEEHIRGLTGKPFNRFQWMQLIDPNWQKQMPLEKFHGLSLNKVLDFGKPGQLISWDNKRYHMAKPFMVAGKSGIGKQNRLMLQYESLCL